MRTALTALLLILTGCNGPLDGGSWTDGGNRFDFDGDGLEDLAVGARREAQNTGAVYVFKGTPLPGDRHADHADLVLAGPGPFAFYGEQITGCDLDDDGMADLVIGGEGLEVFFGAEDFFSRAHPGLRSSTDTLGRALACGDVTGDGVADLVALDDEGPALRVFAGGPHWAEEALSIRPEDAAWTLADEALWDAVIDLGDVDGDGGLDLVIGAHRAEGGAGEVRVHRGGALQVEWARWSGAPGAALGRSVVAVDLDLDGVHDVAAGSLAGAIEVYRGGEVAPATAAAVVRAPSMVDADPAWSAVVQRPWRHDLAALTPSIGGMLQVRARMSDGVDGAVFLGEVLSGEPVCVGITSDQPVQLASSVGALRFGDETQVVMGAPGAPSATTGRVLAFPPSALSMDGAPACTASSVRHAVEDLSQLSLTGPRSFGESMGH